MNLKNKKIGVWGLGAVGQATVSFLYQQRAQITVCNDKKLSLANKKFLQKHNAFFMPQSKIDDFLKEQEIIIPSPGIDLAPYKKYHHKFLAELDLFQAFCNTPIIAITGSVGKTTITSLLANILKKYGHTILVGGNIGTPALDLILHQKVDYVILEVSSFQLELCKTFAPDLAIIANFHPNHLDRHKTIKNYLKAKLQILYHQSKYQKALVPLDIIEKIPKHIHSAVYFFSDEERQKMFLKRHSCFFMVKNHTIMRQNDVRNKDINPKKEKIISLSDFPKITFAQNWLIIVAALSLLGKKIKSKNIQHNFIVPEHRLEKVATINGITFYNDSKATTPASTLAAINQLQNKPIHLFLGGLSKGVDRTSLIKQLKNNVCFVYCFGQEAEQLYTLCLQEQISAQAFCDLDTAFLQCVKKAQPGEQIVLSPGGSSFDLFKNYQERGKYFKKLIKTLT